MRKILLFVFLAIPFISFSQSIGIKGGVNIGKIDIDAYYMNDAKSIITPSFGLVFYPGISKIFDIGIEPTYSSYGYKQTRSFSDINGNMLGDRTYKVKGHYIEVPITFNVFPINKSFIFGAHIGASPMLNIGSSSNYDIKPDYNTFLIAGLGGLTVGYQINEKTYLHLTGRYQFSFNNVYDNSSIDNRIKTINSFVTVGYKF